MKSSPPLPEARINPEPLDATAWAHIEGDQQPEVDQTRTITIGGYECLTNLPEGMAIFKDEAGINPNINNLLVHKLDELEPNIQYYVKWNQEIEYLGVVERTHTVTLVVDTPPVGKAYAQEYTNPITKKDRVWRQRIPEETKEMLSRLGYIFQESDNEGDPYIVGIPTPESLKHAAEQQGINVRLIPDFNDEIDGKVYLDAFANGEYPVSTNNSAMYEHDISDDHLTAMLLGGDLLKNLLQGEAQKALESGNKQHIDAIAKGFDLFTSCLRGVTAKSYSLTDERYNEENGIGTLIEHGENIGLEKRHIIYLLQECQGNAKGLGMTVKNLKIPTDY